MNFSHERRESLRRENVERESTSLSSVFVFGFSKSFWLMEEKFNFL